MHRLATRWMMVAASATGLAVVVSCGDMARPVGARTPAGLSFESHAADFEISRDFTPLASSAVCSVGGGLEQILLPTGFVATLVASEPAFPDNIDMNTVNETGAEPGRFLYRTHEISPNAGVSVTDLETGETRILARRQDWERFDGIAWTPWGTILASEEVNPSPTLLHDPDFPNATAGLVYEIDPSTGGVHARPALGSDRKSVV